jgi:ATP-independent RNA helicase DbpA
MLVLDEADRMLDMGFEEEMEVIMDEAPRTRQTVFFSATYPPFIKGLSRKYQDDPVLVKIDDGPGTQGAIRQYAVDAAGEEKITALFKVLKQHRPKSALIFCNHKATVDSLNEALLKHNISSTVLHGDLEQRDRDRVMAMFRNGSVRILVATDVAARGLDVSALDLVVNFDLPHQPEIYIHRIGRTGRAGEDGLAVSLVNPSERGRLNEFLAFPGIQLNGEDPSNHPRASGSQALHTPADMRTLVISGGRKDKLRPGDILGALTGEAGLVSESVGKIEIHDRFSYVAVALEQAESALQRLQAGKIKGRRFAVKFVR